MINVCAFEKKDIQIYYKDTKFCQYSFKFSSN